MHYDYNWTLLYYYCFIAHHFVLKEHGEQSSSGYWCPLVWTPQHCTGKIFQPNRVSQMRHSVCLSPGISVFNKLIAWGLCSAYTCNILKICNIEQRIMYRYADCPSTWTSKRIILTKLQTQKGFCVPVAESKYVSIASEKFNGSRWNPVGFDHLIIPSVWSILKSWSVTDSSHAKSTSQNLSLSLSTFPY